MSSSISVTQKHIILTSSSFKDKVPLSPASRYFLSFLAVWAFLNVLRVLRPSSLPYDYDIVVRERDLGGRDQDRPRNNSDKILDLANPLLLRTTSQFQQDPKVWFEGELPESTHNKSQRKTKISSGSDNLTSRTGSSRDPNRPRSRSDNTLDLDNPPLLRTTSQFLLDLEKVWFEGEPPGSTHNKSSRTTKISSGSDNSTSQAGPGRDEPSSWNWAQQSEMPQLRPCLNFSDSYRRSSPGGGGGLMPRKYMMVVVNGGLNQQRQQIIDAVVVARIIGATLVLPLLQVNQVWGDDSEFADIFDDRHFKKVLKDDVMIVSSLPASYLNKRQRRGEPMPFHADEKWIRENYQSKLGKDSILLLHGFDSRLAKDLHVDLQKLRCKTAFEALKFQPEIEEMAARLVERIGREGPYMALHLRLEKDVWVHTGCPSGLGREADRKIDHERASNPRLLTSRRYKLTARDRYVAGMCPLNANELSRMLRGLGAPKSTRIYWAGGEPFGGHKALKPLQARFPNLHNKWSLTSAGELDGIRNKPSILAALDYIVCLKSKSFIASHGGNMANSLQDHRIYMGYGMPIVPKKKPLVHLFMNKSLHEDEIDREIKHIHTGYLNSNEKTGSISLGIRNCVCSGSMPS